MTPNSQNLSQNVYLAPFMGSNGKGLQFILLGSAVFSLFFFICLPLFFDLNDLSEGLLKFVFAVTSGLSIFGYYSLYTESNTFSIKRSSLLFIIAEAVILIAFLFSDNLIALLMNKDNGMGLLSIGIMLMNIAPAIFLGDKELSADVKASWPIALGVFRWVVLGLLFWLLTKIFDDLSGIKFILLIIGLANFAITYFMWMSLLAPEKLFYNMKKK